MAIQQRVCKFRDGRAGLRDPTVSGRLPHWRARSAHSRSNISGTKCDQYKSTHHHQKISGVNHTTCASSCRNERKATRVIGCLAPPRIPRCRMMAHKKSKSKTPQKTQNILACDSKATTHGSHARTTECRIDCSKTLWQSNAYPRPQRPGQVQVVASKPQDSKTKSTQHK